MDEPRLTKAATARRLGLSRQWIDYEIARGRLRAEQVAPRVWLVSESDLVAYERRRASEMRQPVMA